MTSEKDDEGIKIKTRRALVKLIIRFCERDELLQRDDEGLAVLLELNNVLDSLIEVRSPASGTGAATQFVSMDKPVTLERQATSEVMLELQMATLEWQAAWRTLLDSEIAQGERLHQQWLLQCFSRCI